MVTFSLSTDGAPNQAVEASEALVTWLQQHAQHESIRSLDPYGDAQLSGPSVAAWADAVAALLTEKRREVSAALATRSRLPQDAAVRQQVLAGLLERERARDEVLDGLTRLSELLEVARREGGRVDLHGD
jgi:erythromycin esterase-like protein